MKIYILHNGQQKGPYPLNVVQAGLDAGKITPSHLAWQEGLPNWIPVTQIPGISSPALPASPPPIPPPAPQSSSQNAYASQTEPSRVSCLAMLGSFMVCSLLYAFIVFSFFGVLGDPTNQTSVLLVNAFSLLLIIATSIWVFFDAGNIESDKGQVAGFVNMPPWAWLVSCLLFWIFAFPIYMVVRYEIKKVNDKGFSSSPAALDSHRGRAQKNAAWIIGGIGIGLQGVSASFSSCLMHRRL
jgi:hypothetical protein